MGLGAWTMFTSGSTAPYSTTNGKYINLIFSKASKSSNEIWLDDGILYSSTQTNIDLVGPNAPTGLSGSASGNVVTLNWTATSDSTTGTPSSGVANGIPNASAFTGVQSTVVLRAANSASTVPFLNPQAVYMPAGIVGGPSTDQTGVWTIVAVVPTSASGGAAANGSTLANSTSYTETTPGTYKYAVIQQDLAFNYSPAATCSGVTILQSPPALTATSTSVDNSSFTITFPSSGNSAYETAVAAGTIKIGAAAPVSLTYGTDWTISSTPVGGNYQIIFTPGSSALPHKSGIDTFSIIVSNYQTGTVYQTLTPGVPTHIAIGTPPATTANGVPLTTQPTVLIEDQYNNITTSTLSVTAAYSATSSGIWTLGGTTTVSASNGTATFGNISATSSSSVTSAVITFSCSSFSTINSAGFSIPAATPIVTTNGTLANFGTVAAGSVSTEKTYTVSGANLTDSIITVTAPTDFQVSKIGGGVGFGSSVTYPQSGGTVTSQTVYVRFAPASGIGAESANIRDSSFGATTITTAVAGTSIPAAPTAVGTLNIGSATSTTIVLNYTPAASGGGARRTIVAYAGSAPGFVPSNGTSYSANATYASGTNQTGNGVIVYDGAGSGNSLFTLTTPTNTSTSYYFAVYEYNGTGASANYYTTPATMAPTITIDTVTNNFDGNLGYVPDNFVQPSGTAYQDVPTFNITATNSTASVVLTAPGSSSTWSFVFSTTNASGGFSSAGSAVSIPTVNGALSQQVWMHGKPINTLGFVSGNVTITSGAAVGSGFNLPVSEYGIAVNPGNQANGFAGTTLTAGTATATSIPLTLSTAVTSPVTNGTNRIIVANAGTPPTYVPANNAGSPNVNDTFSSATDLGGGRIVFDGLASITSATVYGLTPGTTYYFIAYDYNKSGSSFQSYNTFYYTPTAISKATPVATDYYTAASGNIDVTTTYGVNTDGSGPHPSSLTLSGITYHIANGNPGNTSGGSVTVSNLSTSTATLTGNTTVTGTLTLSGPLTVASNTLTINDFSGSSTNGLNVTSGSTVTTTGALSNPLYFVSGNNTLGTLNIGGNATLGNALNMASTSGTVSVGTGATLTTGGFLTLLSDATGTARIPALSGTLSGTVNIQRYVPGQRGYRLLGHPYTSGIDLNQLYASFDITGLTGNAGSTCTGTNPSVFSYTAGTGGYTAITDSSVLFPAVQSSGSSANGILAFIRGSKGQDCNSAATTSPSNITFTTASGINQGDVTETVPAGGWNLIANPYPCQVLLSSVSNIGSLNAIVVVQPAQQNGGNTYQNGTAYFTASSSYVLPINGAFLANNTTGSPISLVFHESTKSATTPTTGMLKTTNVYPTIELSVYNGTAFWDVWQMSFRPGATGNAGESGDLGKLSNAQFNISSLSADNQQLAWDARDESTITDGTVIPMNISSVPKTTYTLQVSDYSLPANKTVYLHDKYTNSYVLLNNGTSYPFTVNSDLNSQGQNRIELLFNDVNNNTGVASVNTQSNVRIVPNPATNNINLSYNSSFTGVKQISIINALGQVVKTLATGEQNVNVSVSDLPGGIYIVKTTTGNSIFTERFIKN